MRSTLDFSTPKAGFQLTCAPQAPDSSVLPILIVILLLTLISGSGRGQGRTFAYFIPFLVGHPRRLMLGSCLEPLPSTGRALQRQLNSWLLRLVSSALWASLDKPRSGARAEIGF